MHQDENVRNTKKDRVRAITFNQLISLKLFISVSTIIKTKGYSYLPLAEYSQQTSFIELTTKVDQIKSKIESVKLSATLKAQINLKLKGFIEDFNNLNYINENIALSIGESNVNSN